MAPSERDIDTEPDGAGLQDRTLGIDRIAENIGLPDYRCLQRTRIGEILRVQQQGPAITVDAGVQIERVIARNDYPGGIAFDRRALPPHLAQPPTHQTAPQAAEGKVLVGRDLTGPPRHLWQPI